MLYLSLAYPHPPYNIEETYLSLYDPGKITSPVQRSHENENPGFMEYVSQCWGIDRLNDFEKKRIIATYYAMITRTDDLIGNFLHDLEASGLREDTIIIFTSDHGDYTCDYNLVEKWESGMTDNLVKVPIIISVPGTTDKGAVIDSLVESIDIFPTIMELSGIKTYHQQSGKSLLPLLLDNENRHRELVISEGGRLPDKDKTKRSELEIERKMRETKTVGDRDHYFNKGLIPYNYHHYAIMVRNEKYKYIRRLEDTDEFFDLINDPQERVNLINEPLYYPNIIEMKECLLDHYMYTLSFTKNPSGKRDLDEYEKDYI